MGETSDLHGRIFRSKAQQISETIARSPLTKASDFQRLQVTQMSEVNRHNTTYIPPANQDKYELMNITIVIYGLNGLVCEQEPKKRQKIGKKEKLFPAVMGAVRKETNLESNTKERKPPTRLDSTVAVVSCQRDGTSNNISFDSFLPSLTLRNPMAISLNKVRYDAAWPSEQSILIQDEGSLERSAFVVTRFMKQSAFTPGIGAGSNYCHETLELGINMSRGTELIRLGTALVAINGEEEGEVKMNIPTTPTTFEKKKLKKKKKKYGYFSNDSSRRFYLDKNSILKIGVQVIPEEAIRFAREKDEKRSKKEKELNEFLEHDDLKDLLQQMSNDNLVRERIQIKSLPIDPGTTINGVIPERKQRSSFSDIFCGSIPTAWVPYFLKRPETEPDIPLEITTTDDIDQLAIQTLISSVSESTDEDSCIFEDVAGEL